MGIKIFKKAAPLAALLLTTACIFPGLAQGDNLQKWLDYGNQMELKGNMAEAARAYSQVIKQVPNNYDAYVHRANVYRVLHQYPQALADYNKALSLQPGDASAQAGRAFNYIAMNQPGKAVEDFNKAIPVFQRDASQIGHLVEAYVGRADASVQLRLYDQAIQDYKYALRLNPTQTAAYEGRATAWFGLNRIDLAIDDVSRAIDLKQAPALYELRYMLYKKTNDVDKQYEDLTVLMRLEPDKVQWVKEHLKIAEDRKDKAMIAEDLGKLLAFDKTDVQGRVRHALMTWEDSPQSAIKDLDEAIDTTGGTAELYGLRGQIEAKLGYNDSAFTDLNKAIQMDPKRPDNYIYRASTRYANRDYYKAIDDADKAIAIDPKAAESYFFKGCAHESLGQTRDALSNYEKYVSLKSEIKRKDMGENEKKQFEVAERKLELLKRAAALQEQNIKRKE